MSSIKAARLTASQRLLSVLSGYDRYLIVMHDNPDPDAIATGWAIRILIEEKFGREARLVGSGEIVRAENRRMVELLHPPLELTDDLDVREDTATILVDCSPGTTNQLLTREDVCPVAVIDHHSNGTCEDLAFHDIRPYVAASASIAASYLREQKIEPGTKLATAMIYAIHTETRGCETHFSALDRSILPWLTERAEPALLAEIENAPLPRAYFGDLLLAMQCTFLYDDCAFCLLPRASGPEIVGEVADLLIRGEGVRRVFCGAIIGGDVLVSVRTEPGSGHAAELVQKTLDGLGRGGGHAHRAGGKIPGAGNRSTIAQELESELRTRWVTACGVDRRRGTRLVPKREIVENL